ncbi:MAG: hypothetical protein E7121_06230 [Bacteroidales bacterium]|nr:hypothetical protein [Bacteroidales bacterium]MBQ7997792.1 hypothetical protein [Bacteroidales bacterium]
MKKVFLVIIFGFSVMTSCNVVNEDISNIEKISPFIENEPYSFNKVTEPSVWTGFSSLKEMQDACQIPENWLDRISTKNLVETCMNYPLYGLYMAYNNELDGIKVLMDGFNGFTELKHREDAAEELLNYYENIMFIKTKSGERILKEQVKPLRLGYLELILVSNQVPNLYNERNIDRLETLMRAGLQMKIQCPEIFSMQTVKKTLLIGAKLKLERYPIDQADSVMLNDFISNGGNVSDPIIYTKVANIIK